MDFTESNKELSPEILNDTQRFSDYINFKLQISSDSYRNCKFGIGGYNEVEIKINNVRTSSRNENIVAPAALPK